MAEGVRHLDTKSFNDTISAYANCMAQFGGIVEGVNAAASAILGCWKGRGRDAFAKDCEQVRRNLGDISDIMADIRDALAEARDAYMQTDSELSTAYAGAGGAGAAGVAGAAAGGAAGAAGVFGAVGGGIGYGNGQGASGNAEPIMMEFVGGRLVPATNDEKQPTCKPTYKMANNFSDNFLYNQNDYEHDADGDSYRNGGRNVACTVTAELMAWSMMHNARLTPDQVTSGWGWDATNGCNVTKWNYTDPGYERNEDVSQAETLRYSYNKLQEGKPTLIRVSNDGGHSIVVVGVHPAADPLNLQPSDFIVADPYGAQIKSLSDGYTIAEAAIGHFIRIPK
ncbi:MAG: WXG100 family type VII secretion target [Clostridiales bacterium]|jgi:WXG100 family type VII secretion target|nr:WXG100 family type VII secretion target [Clostridiales bacterium]